MNTHELSLYSGSRLRRQKSVLNDVFVWHLSVRFKQPTTVRTWKNGGKAVSILFIFIIYDGLIVKILNCSVRITNRKQFEHLVQWMEANQNENLPSIRSSDLHVAWGYLFVGRRCSGLTFHKRLQSLHIAIRYSMLAVRFDHRSVHFLPFYLTIYVADNYFHVSRRASVVCLLQQRI